MIEKTNLLVALQTMLAMTLGCAAEGALRATAERSQIHEASQADGAVAPSTGDAGGDFPCDVRAILVERCTVCHGAPPVAAPFALTTPAHFRGKSYSDEATSMVDMTRERLNAENEGRLMPPPALGTLTEEELKTLNDWLDGGAKASATACDDRTDAPANTEAGVGADTPTVDGGSET